MVAESIERKPAISGTPIVHNELDESYIKLKQKGRKRKAGRSGGGMLPLTIKGLSSTPRPEDNPLYKMWKEATENERVKNK